MAVSMESIKNLRASTGAGMLDCKNALEACNGDEEKAADWLREKGIAKAAKKASRIAAEGLTNFAVCGNYAALVEINSETDFVAKNASFQEVVKKVAEAIAAAHPATMEEANEVKVSSGETIAELIVNTTATIGEKISFRRFEVVEKEADAKFGCYVHNGKIGVIVNLHGGDEELAKGLAMHIAALAPQYVAFEDIPSEIVAREQTVQTEAAKNDPKLAGKPEAALVKILEGKVKKALSDVCLLEQEYVKDPKKVSVVLSEANAKVVSFTKFVVGEGIEKRQDNFAEEVMAQINR